MISKIKNLIFRIFFLNMKKENGACPIPSMVKGAWSHDQNIAIAKRRTFSLHLEDIEI